jgi:hypothetical protein
MIQILFLKWKHRAWGVIHVQCTAWHSSRRKLHCMQFMASHADELRRHWLFRVRKIMP